MTITQISVLLIRIVSISFLLDAVIVLTELPVVIFDISKSQVDYIISEHEFSLVMLLVRLFIYLVAGICFLIFARPLGKLFAKGLENINHN
jgi:hypothetical protein